MSGTFYAALVFTLAGAAFVYGLRSSCRRASTSRLRPACLLRWRPGCFASVLCARVASLVGVRAHDRRELLQEGTFPWLSLIVVVALAMGLTALAACEPRARDI